MLQGKKMFLVCFSCFPDFLVTVISEHPQPLYLLLAEVWRGIPGVESTWIVERLWWTHLSLDIFCLAKGRRVSVFPKPELLNKAFSTAKVGAS